MKVLGIIGSVFGVKTKVAMEHLEFSENVNFETIDLSQINLAFSDGRDFRDYDATTRDVVEKILDADALVLGSPVYNASIPGSLKNVLDLLPIDSIKDKAVGVVMTAGSNKHYLVAQYHLLPVLEYMKASVIDKYVFMTDEDFISSKKVSDDVYFRLKALTRDIENRVKSIQKEHAERYDF